MNAVVYDGLSHFIRVGVTVTNRVDHQKGKHKTWKHGGWDGELPTLISPHVYETQQGHITPLYVL